MSDKTPNPAVPADTNVEQETEAPKQNLVQRALAPIKKHPKIATAVGLGVALVGVAAVTGRATAPDAEVYLLPVTPVEDDETESVDVPVA